MATVAAPAPAPPPGRSPRRFTVREFQRLAEIGVLHEDDRCELVRGFIYAAMPPNPPHVETLHRVRRRVSALTDPLGLNLGIQDPIALADSQPLPDLYVANGPEGRFATDHPTPSDLVLVVEVSDTTVAYDQGTKLELYAEAGVQVYWVVNIPAQRVEVYTQPAGGQSPTYQTQTDYPPGQSVPVVLAGQTVGSIPVSELFP